MLATGQIIGSRSSLVRFLGCISFAEGGAALHATQGKLCCAPTTGTKGMLSPNRSNASDLPSAGLSAAEERRGSGQGLCPDRFLANLRESTFPNLMQDKSLHLLRNQGLEKQDLGGTSTGNPLRQFLHCFREHARVHVDVRLRRFRTHQRHIVKRRQQDSSLQRVKMQKPFQLKICRRS